MADLLVLEWMEEFESLTESEIHTYSTEQEHNQEVMIALYAILTQPYKYKPKLVDGICRQLLDFYRSGEKQLKKFTMQYIPILIFLHLCNKAYSSVQALLISLYNLEIIDSRGQPRCLSFRIPSIAQSSIYHDSNNLEPAFMAENSLRRYEECNSKLVNWGPIPQVEYLNAQNRQRVITALMFLYNQQISDVMTHGIEHTCRGISSVVNQGFQSYDNLRNTSNDPNSDNNMTIRLPVSSNFLLELLHFVYHASERGVSGAVQALEDVYQRALYEAYSDVILMARAIKNLIMKSPSMCIMSRSAHHQTISKSMITNASFRTKKLPDDIPILDEHPAEGLDSITEEQEELDKNKIKGSVSALKHLPKLSGLTKKHKVKNTPGDQQTEMTNLTTDQTMESPPTDPMHALHVSIV